MPNSEEFTDVYECRDGNLSMCVPLYLHQKKRGIAFFEAKSKKKNDNLIHGFSIEILNEDGLKAHQRIMTFTNPRANEEYLGVRGEVIRRGKPSYLADGLEVLGVTHVRATGKTMDGYEILFPLGSRHVYATFFGQGELAAFEKTCRQIILSVRLAEPGEATPSLPRQQRASSGLGLADTTRLKQVLDSLPPAIAYLRKAILAIAKQDPDLLVSGEADIGPIEKALQKVAEGGAVGEAAAIHADTLHDWLVSLPDCDGAWTTPLGFILGYLRGVAQFGSGSNGV